MILFLDHTRTIHTVEVAASGRIWHYSGGLISKLVFISLALQVKSSVLNR